MSGDEKSESSMLRLLCVGMFAVLMVAVAVCTVLVLEMGALRKDRDRILSYVTEMNDQLDLATAKDSDTNKKLNELTDLYENLLIELEEDDKEEAKEEQVSQDITGAKHKVYLTFDDGPSKNTREILDILDRYGVKATFFVCGKEDAESIEALKEIAARGHTIGMHSYSHDYGSLYNSLDGFVEDYHRISDYIYDNTGIRSTIYRFPGGSSNTVSNISMIEAARYLYGSGVVYYDWNVSSGDAEGKKLTTSKLIDNCILNIDKRETSIILLHDAASKDTTVEALPELIEKIQAMEDTEILPITEGTVPIQHIKVN